MSNWRARRGSFVNRGRAGRATRGPPRPQTPELAVGDLIQSITTQKLRSTETAGPARITDCSLLTSFNWLSKSTEPTILIPGEPPRWTPLPEAVKLPEDAGEYYRDQNAARFPAHPMEPTISAILDAKRPDLPDVQLVACGSTFGNLLRFSRGLTKPFRILVETVGGTVFLLRREKSPTEKIQDVRGYGHAFPEAYTTWSASVAGSESHQRILRYQFGGLDIVIRYESDGYVAGTTISDAGHQSNLRPSNSEFNVDDLTAELDRGLSVEGSCTLAGELRVQHKGTRTSQERQIDIKTRSHKKKDIDTLGEEIPRFWARQVPKFVLAHHMNGTFHDVKVHDIRDKVEAWEAEHQDELEIFARLLQKIIEVVQRHAKGKLEIVCAGGMELAVREQLDDAGSVCSEAMKARWEVAMHTTGQDIDGVLLSPATLPDASNPVGEEDDGGWDSGGELDYTACSVDGCGYCGKCTY